MRPPGSKCAGLLSASLWGDQDDTVGREAAEGTGEFIAAPYQFEALPGVAHYAADQVPEQVNASLLAHLARHPT
jgi:pimeloyl-ACP methyl ester carboxylesterase